MWTVVDRGVRRLLATAFPGRFPTLYTTLDNPVPVPVQLAAYKLASRKYIRAGDRVLDVGFGLGYGLAIMARQGAELTGIEIDQKAVFSAQRLVSEVPGIHDVRLYDGWTIPFDDRSFDVVTCVDVIEHVPDYMRLITQMIRLANRTVLISTPNRRPEYTRLDGRPKNRWHLREWSCKELDAIVGSLSGIDVEWNFLDGPLSGPFQCRSVASRETMALTPALLRTRNT